MIYADGHITSPSDDDQEFTFEKFAAYFDGVPGTITDRQLLAMIYADAEHHLEDDEKLKLLDIHLWMNNIDRSEFKKQLAEQKVVNEVDAQPLSPMVVMPQVP